eukprot:TRINITY_DN11636_c0_g1_i1.p1 TRINITY_DN11636_c0_g1~~TRINITY_DN11636_c0_g1_i1.p1  ORF type:complete len:1581 (+),score=611.47 TRINITY_DN11636_c0_g1_i1:70-4812(+)
MEPKKVESAECSVTVAVRIRPMNKREKGMNAKHMMKTDRETETMWLSPLDKDKQKHSFTFDHAWDSSDPNHDEFVSQETVYNDIGKPVLAAAFQGYNACIFAYGQTGSGKTFSMMGLPDDEVQAGVIPRLCRQVFAIVDAKAPPAQGVLSQEYQVEASYLEIYQEHVKCLLNPRKENLKVREHPVTGPYVEDLTKLVVGGYPHVLRLIEEGSKVRQVGATNMNDQSSRSHAIFTLTLTKTQSMKDSNGKVLTHHTVSRINLVDLAGSERAKATGATGSRLAEGANINKSLSTLGLVISGLAEMSKKKSAQKHIPYRDSTLTWLLKDNLGGNSKTFMISTVSPACVNHDESLSTLRYADRAKQIITKAKVNEDPNSKLIRQLREELAKYKAKLDEYESAPAPKAPTLRGTETTISSTPRMSESMFVTDDTMMTPRGRPANSKEAGMIREKLLAMEKLMEEATMTAAEKEEQSRIQEEARRDILKELGIRTLHAGDQQPHFVNLVLDGGWVLQYIDTGVPLVIGSGAQCGLRLMESGANPEHAVVRRGEDGVTTIENVDDALLTVHNITPACPEDSPSKKSDSVVSGSYVLTHGAEIDIGDNIFRYVDPTVSVAQKAERKRLHAEFLRAAREGRDGGGDAWFTPRHAGRPSQAKEDDKDEELRGQIRGEVVADQQQQKRLAQSDRQASYLSKGTFEGGSTSAATSPRDEGFEGLEGRGIHSASPGRPVPALNGVQAAEGVNRVPPIPILRLSEVAGKSQALARSTGSARRNSVGSRKELFTKQPLTSRFPKERFLAFFKQTVVFIGASGVGKTAVKKCLQKDLSFWERKDVPPVAPTLGVEHTELHGLVDGAKVTLLLQDPSGAPQYDPCFPHLVPDQRCIFLLCWNMAGDYEEAALVKNVDQALHQAPSAAFILIGTHRDKTKAGDKEVHKSLCLVEKAVLGRMKVFYRHQKEMQSMNPAPQLLATYAVSCKNRTVLTEGSSYKFDTLRQVILQAAYDRCIIDPHFPGGKVPSSVLTLGEKIVNLRRDGTWSITGAEFKLAAASAAPQYNFDMRELARVTALLHSWRVLLHFSSHPVIRKQVFTDPLWVFRLIEILSTYHAYHAAAAEGRAGKINARSLPFAPSDAIAKDPTNSFLRGILTVPLAMQLFRQHLGLIGHGPKDIAKCLQLLLSFDILYSVIPPGGIWPSKARDNDDATQSSTADSDDEEEIVPSVITPTTPLPRRGASHEDTLVVDGVAEACDPADANRSASKMNWSMAGQRTSAVCLVPSLFTHPFPQPLIDCMPAFMAGVRKRVLFRPTLPAGLFSRLLSRIARCVQRLYVGKVESLSSDPYVNNFWRNGAWVQDSPTTRALVWTPDTDYSFDENAEDGNSIFVVSGIPTGGAARDGTAGATLLDGILKSIKSLAGEHAGVEAVEAVPCTTRGCAGWVPQKKEGECVCPRCGETLLRYFDAERVAEQRQAALDTLVGTGMDDEVVRKLSTLSKRLETEEVEEPTDAEVTSAQVVLTDHREVGATYDTQLAAIRAAIDRVVELKGQGQLEEADRLESAINVTNTHDKLVSSALALDEIVEALTCDEGAGPP